jgi:hypothetical protein
LLSKRSRSSPASKNREPSPSGRRSTPAAIRYLIIAAISLVVLFLFVKPLYVVPDSAAYLAYGRSMLWDGDVDFENDYARLGMVDLGVGGSELGARTETGKRGNPFGIGAAFLWLPFMIVVAVVAKIAALLGADVASDGFGMATLWAAHIGTWSYLAAAFALVVRTAKEFFGASGSEPRKAALAGAFLGTPLVYYVLQAPSYSHACSVFSVSLLFYLAMRFREAWTPRRALILGAAAGLTALVRTQGVVFWVVPLFLGWKALRSGGAAAFWKRVGLYAAGAAVLFAPQLVAWTVIYGSPWHLPQGEGFLHFSFGRLMSVAFSARHGLFSWSPVFALAAAGWVMALRRREWRAPAAAILVAFALQWFVNTLPNDWWAGWSFGARRFIDFVPFAAVGLLVFCRAGIAARAAVYAVTALSLVQWLRISTGGISGETDPGWNALWGSGFLSSLAKIPAALWSVLSASPTDLQVLRRPSAVPPTLYSDPAGLFDAFFFVWAVLVLWAVYKTYRWWGGFTSSANKDA